MKRCASIFMVLALLKSLPVFASYDSLPALPHSYLNYDMKILCYMDSPVLSEKQYKKIMDKCGIKNYQAIDFNKYNLWMRHSMGDCHARFVHRMEVDSANCTITWIEWDHYGGCRAAKFEEYWILFPKLEGEWHYRMREVRVDRH